MRGAAHRADTLQPPPSAGPAAPRTPLTGVKCQDRDKVLEALEAIMQHAVQMLCAYIDQGGHAAPPSTSVSISRNLVAALLNKMPLTCTRMRTNARGDLRYTAVMYYERTRLGAAGSGHFLEALPPGLPLFSGHTSVELKDEDLRKLKLRDVVSDRIRTVVNLEGLDNNSERLLGLISDYTLPDVAPNLPGRVHVFVARMRAICQGLRRVKPEGHFRRCKNCECSRLFYSGAATEVGPSSNASAPATPVGASYWDLAAGSPEVAHEQSEFCTWSCCMQWRWQLTTALPEASELVLVADRGCRKTGRSRVSEAMRKCSKRNETAGRHLRTIQKEHRVFPAISKTELGKQRERRIRMLNIDLGMLFSASVLAESKNMCTNKVLAGASEGWRSRPMFYAKAIKEVTKLYAKHHVGGNVISNLLVHEPFLKKLREKATNIF